MLDQRPGSTLKFALYRSKDGDERADVADSGGKLELEGANKLHVQAAGISPLADCRQRVLVPVIQTTRILSLTDRMVIGNHLQAMYNIHYCLVSCYIRT